MKIISNAYETICYGKINIIVVDNMTGELLGVY